MIRILSAMILLFALLSPARAGESRAMLAVQQILDQAHTSATDCTRASEALVSILCTKQLRVGLRSYYPGFSVRDESNTFSGFEVDIARRIAVVPQDFSLFHRSAMENIRYGRPDATDAEVIESAELANCRDFVEALPEGQLLPAPNPGFEARIAKLEAELAATRSLTAVETH